MRRSPLLPETTLGVWLARIGETPDRRLVEAATDLVETMFGRPEGLCGALYRFGNTLGADGWPISQVSRWLEALSTELDRGRRKALTRFSSHAAMAQGWADGYVRGAHTGMCIDPTTGLVTAMVLRIRLSEVFEQCAANDTHAADLFTLVLVDVDLHGMQILDADLLMAVVADSVRSVFRHGETCARVGSRIVVLATKSEATDHRLDILMDRLRLDESLVRAHAGVVQDELPHDPQLLDSYLRDLVD